MQLEDLHTELSWQTWGLQATREPMSGERPRWHHLLLDPDLDTGSTDWILVTTKWIGRSDTAQPSTAPQMGAPLTHEQEREHRGPKREPNWREADGAIGAACWPTRPATAGRRRVRTTQRTFRTSAMVQTKPECGAVAAEEEKSTERQETKIHGHSPQNSLQILNDK